MLAAILVWDTIRFETEARPAEVRAAYKLGIQVAVNAPELDAIKAGQIPRPIVEGRVGDVNSFVWSRASLERPGNCLNATQGKPSDPDCERPDSLTPNSYRLVFSRLQNGAHQIGVDARPLTAGQMEAFGTVYGVEGEIGIGRDFQTSSRFKVEIEGGLAQGDAAAGAATDEAEIEGEENCTAARITRPIAPFVIAKLPGTLSRQCSFVSSDQRRLVLMQLQHGLFQQSLAIRKLNCRALLRTAIRAARAPDFAGCLSANWSKTESPVAALVLFQSLGDGEWAVIK